MVLRSMRTLDVSPGNHNHPTGPSVVEESRLVCLVLTRAHFLVSIYPEHGHDCSRVPQIFTDSYIGTFRKYFKKLMYFDCIRFGFSCAHFHGLKKDVVLKFCLFFLFSF